MTDEEFNPVQKLLLMILLLYKLKQNVRSETSNKKIPNLDKSFRKKCLILIPTNISTWLAFSRNIQWNFVKKHSKVFHFLFLRFFICSEICENRWLSRDSCKSGIHYRTYLCSQPSSSFDSMVNYSPSLSAHFHTTWLLFLFTLLFPILTRLITSPLDSTTLNSIPKCDKKGFIITIQSNSIRIEVE